MSFIAVNGHFILFLSLWLNAEPKPNSPAVYYQKVAQEGFFCFPSFLKHIVYSDNWTLLENMLRPRKGHIYYTLHYFQSRNRIRFSASTLIQRSNKKYFLSPSSSSLRGLIHSKPCTLFKPLLNTELILNLKSFIFWTVPFLPECWKLLYHSLQPPKSKKGSLRHMPQIPVYKKGACLSAGGQDAHVSWHAYI